MTHVNELLKQGCQNHHEKSNDQIFLIQNFLQICKLPENFQSFTCQIVTKI